MAKMSIAEVVTELQKCQTKTERINILKSNDSSALRGLLRMNYDANLKLSLPEGVPPYKKADVPQGFGESTLLSTAKGWYIFTQQGAPNLKQSKREYLYIKLLESLDPVEANIFILAKDKKLDLGLTKLVINEIFPDLIQAESVKNDNKEKPKKVSTKSTSKSDGKGVRDNIDV